MWIPLSGFFQRDADGADESLGEVLCRVQVAFGEAVRVRVPDPVCECLDRLPVVLGECVFAPSLSIAKDFPVEDFGDVVFVVHGLAPRDEWFAHAPLDVRSQARHVSLRGFLEFVFVESSEEVRFCFEAAFEDDALCFGE